jgi:hypothetical protein
MNISEANAITGGLSVPSKMPGFAYNLPARRCHVGGRLRKVVGSVCDDCYAMKGRYNFPNVRDSLERKYQSLIHPLWVKAMVVLITRRSKTKWFRWHDSGDLQSVWHLRRIVAVCNATPEFEHWIPTREYGIVREFLDSGGIIPPNLRVRLSATMVDGPLPLAFAKRHGLTVSGVSRHVFTCPASKQDNECKDCRMCWDSTVETVIYHKH